MLMASNRGESEIGRSEIATARSRHYEQTGLLKGTAYNVLSA